MNAHLVITGATSYIGQAVLDQALAAGLTVTAMGRTPPPSRPGLRWLPWSLEIPVPADALRPGTVAVIHAAHQWHCPKPEAQDVNVVGSLTLLEAARQAGVERFIFCSSVSARADARNRYGRVKAAIAAQLTRPGETSVRIGLVYGGPACSQWKTMDRLAAMAPLLPMVGTGVAVQPIHLDDVAKGLLASTRIDSAKGGHDFILAGPAPMTFGAWLSLLARHRHGHALRILPLPLAPALAVARLGARLLPMLAPIEERLAGMAGLQVLSSADDLRRLGVEPLPPTRRLAQDGIRRHRLLLREGRVLLAALGSPASPANWRAYARAVARTGMAPLALPFSSAHLPWLVRLHEPIRPTSNDGLKARLTIASQIADCLGATAGPYDYQGIGLTRQLSRFVAALAVEAFVLPARLLLGRDE